MNNDTDKKLDQLSKDIKEGHASLQHRHDHADAEMKYLHHKTDRLRSFLYTLWKAVTDIFKKNHE